MCDGTPAIRLYRGTNEMALVTNHHGRSIRCSLWSSDAIVGKPEPWLQWFDARKTMEPRKEVEDMAARAKEAETSYQRWLEAMPKSIRPLWAQTTQKELSPIIEPLRFALANEFPDKQKRVLALFSWFGSGDGPWSGFPAYESVAKELLLDIPTPDLIAAAQTDNLTAAQLEGAGRLLGCWDFSQRRPNHQKNHFLPRSRRNCWIIHSKARTMTSLAERKTHLQSSCC